MKTHINLQQIPDVIRRRKRYLIAPFIIIFVISTIGAYLLPRDWKKGSLVECFYKRSFFPVPRNNINAPSNMVLPNAKPFDFSLLVKSNISIPYG